MDITFASLVTPAGVVVAAGIVTTLVQLIKTAFPLLGVRVSGALMAFVGTAGLYAVTAGAVGVASPDAGLGIFLAWLSCATSAVGIKAALDHANAVTAKP
jgi:hypothetical protein